VKIQESAENYLETIYTLQKRKGQVRSVDIAQDLGYSKPSVSRAMKLLRENAYIVVAEDGMITLTESGMAIAENIFERHTLLTQFLEGLGVSHAVAFEDACRIEHVISQETFDRLKGFVEGL